MSLESGALLLFIAMLLLLLTGLPVAFSLGSISLVVGWFLLGPTCLMTAFSSAFGVSHNYVLIALPLFLLMVSILENSGIADDLYEMMYVWFGGLNGGLAIGTVIICTIMGAMSAVAAAAVVTMAVIALPSMSKRGYDKVLTCGAIAAGGGLGQLIPPSTMMIIYGSLSNASVGRLFIGGVMPGLLIACLFMLYIGVRCAINPKLGPALPPEERGDWSKKIKSLRAVALPLLIVFCVLGSIFGGISTPTEAAALGVFGMLICTILHRRFSWTYLAKACLRTVTVSSMVIWIIIGGSCFSAIFNAMGATDLIREFVLSLNMAPWAIITVMMFTFFVGGCLMDPAALLMITVPIYLPIVVELGLDPIWFGVCVVVNLQIGALTPPMCPNIFYLQAIVGKEIPTTAMYRSIIPFVLLYAVGLALCIVFPQIILWLPNLFLGIAR
ncbi:MAG: TRAP transporter large permease subunit [Synergistaceae bacterium]|jgi:tripartite ATP-independent transporter DctM subunit|nr:TRAP transporter large permease subunit [Synergistaceae bacterium]